jgi:hypothetical protein
VREPYLVYISTRFVAEYCARKAVVESIAQTLASYDERIFCRFKNIGFSNRVRGACMPTKPSLTCRCEMSDNCGCIAAVMCAPS